MDKEIARMLDKYHEELMQWSKEKFHEGMVVSVFGEGLPSNHNVASLK